MPGCRQPPGTRHGPMGGPIRKNKTHYFAGYEGTPRGDFSRTTTAAGTLIRIYDPATNRIVAGRGRGPAPR